MTDTTTQQPPPVTQPRNGLGIAALVTGIVGLALAAIPIIGFTGFILGVLGIIFGAVGLNRVRKGTATNKGVSIAGLVLAALATVVSTAVFIATVVAVDEAVTDLDRELSEQADAGSGEGQEASAAVGDAVRDGKFEFTVHSVETSATIGEGMLEETAQGKYALVKVTVENIGDEAQFLSASDQYVYDADGKQYSSSDDALLAIEDSPFLEEINPGNSVDGTLAFDVPENVDPVSIELHDSPFSDGVTVTLR